MAGALAVIRYAKMPVEEPSTASRADIMCGIRTTKNPRTLPGVLFGSEANLKF
jgi:hypothetical protein